MEKPLIGNQQCQDALNQANYPTYTNRILTLNDLSAAMPYTKYAALLTQGGTGAPSIVSALGSNSNVPFENSLGGTVVFARVTTGVYTGTLNGAFPDRAKLWSTIPGNGVISWNDANSFVIETFDSSGVASDDILIRTPIEIRVYS
jgi:hypothetical protein